MSFKRRKGIEGDWSRRVVTVALTVILAAGAVCFAIVGSWAYADYHRWYDPGRPERAVLVRPNVYLYALALGPLVLVLAAGVLVLKALERYFDERERRALLAGREDEVSRGQLLAVRLVQEWLEADRAAFLAFGAVLAGTLFAAPFAFWAAYALRGHANYVLLLVLGFVAFLALRLSFRAAREALIARRSGTTIVEVSAEPLIAGESFDVWVMQEGGMRLRELALALVCEETVVTRTKKKTKTATRRIADIPIASERNVTVQPEVPFQLRARGAVPADATPSLEEEDGDRSVDWKIEVRGNLPGHPDFARAFPVLVQGPAPG